VEQKVEQSRKVVKQTVQVGQTRSTGPNVNLFRQNKRGAGRLDMKIAGPNTSSSFLWTLVVKKEMTPA
jgi:hypothetical protein